MIPLMVMMGDVLLQRVTQIVEDDVYFALSLVVRNQLLQEGDKLLAGIGA